MPKLSLQEKIALDAQRSTTEERNRVILFREGKFFRAFNYSAWLLSQYVFNEAYRNGIHAQNPLSVGRNQSPTVGEYILCGFPVHSIEKYSGGLPYQVVDDEQAVITLPDYLTDLTDESFRQSYEEYAQSVVAKPKKSDEKRQFGTSDAEGRVRSLGMIDIIRKANNYVLAEHTPMEVMLFFQEIQGDIHKLL